MVKLGLYDINRIKDYMLISLKFSQILSTLSNKLIKKSCFITVYKKFGFLY